MWFETQTRDNSTEEAPTLEFYIVSRGEFNISIFRMITSSEKQNDKDFVKEVETFTVYLYKCTCHTRRSIARVKSQNIII